MTSLPVALDIIFSWHMICSMLLTTLMAHHCILPNLKSSNLWWGGQNDVVFPKHTQVPDAEDPSLLSICCLIQFSVGLTTVGLYCSLFGHCDQRQALFHSYFWAPHLDWCLRLFCPKHRSLCPCWTSWFSVNSCIQPIETPYLSAINCSPQTCCHLWTFWGLIPNLLPWA